MEFIRHELDGVVEIRPILQDDARGSFSEIYKLSAFRAAGVDAVFVQDNRSVSREAGTVRGLHFQLAPAAQAKLVGVVRGAILDVAVDIRRGSATFGRHVAVRLDAARGAHLFLPEGFAHGFCTLEPDTEVRYKVTAEYDPDRDRGLFWADPALAIAWPVPAEAAMLSDKDSRAPMLAETSELF